MRFDTPFVQTLEATVREIFPPRFPLPRLFSSRVFLLQGFLLQSCPLRGFPPPRLSFSKVFSSKCSLRGFSPPRFSPSKFFLLQGFSPLEVSRSKVCLVNLQREFGIRGLDSAIRFPSSKISRPPFMPLHVPPPPF